MLTVLGFSGIEFCILDVMLLCIVALVIYVSVKEYRAAKKLHREWKESIVFFNSIGLADQNKPE